MEKSSTHKQLKLQNKHLQQKISELTKSNERLENLVDMLPQIIIETNLKGNLIYANQKSFELTGYTREDFRNGMTASQFVIPEERLLLVKNMQRVLEGEKLQGGEYTALRKDGTEGMRSIIVDITERKKEDTVREALIVELQEAMEKVRVLSGFIPICAACKQIRDDKGFWNQIENYISEHSDAVFSHSICPPCAKKLYPGLGPY
jgi:PAS domain S-box-containing protein